FPVCTDTATRKTPWCLCFSAASASRRWGKRRITHIAHSRSGSTDTTGANATGIERRISDMNARSATASMDDAFVIGTDPTLSQRVRREMIDTLVANGGVSAADAEREIASRDFAATFERFFGAMGLSPHRLPDVFAAHLLAMWSIVHQQSLPDRVVAEGVRTQFETLLRGRPEARNAEQRQLIGEALLCESVLS